MSNAEHHDRRKVRFVSIAGLTPDDLPLAYEIWLDDLYRAPWANREAMRLGAHLVTYMQRPKDIVLSSAHVETACQLSLEEARKTLQMMRNFGAVDTFVYDRTDVSAGLVLSIMQRLRVLETRERLMAVTGKRMITPEPEWRAAEAA